jgi:hypothetical protein
MRDGRDNRAYGNLRIMLTLVLLIGHLGTGCGIRGAKQTAGGDRRAFLLIEERIATLGGLRASGRVAVEYRDQTWTFPFELTMGSDRSLDATAVIGESVFGPGGPVRLVSNRQHTLVLLPTGPVDAARYTEIDPEAMHALLVSMAGGGELLVEWLSGQGCPVGKETSCGGLEMSFSLDESRRSVASWEIGHPSSGSRLEGMVFDRFEGTPPLPRILSGVFHPRGVLITVKYDDMESLEGPGPGR